MVKLGVSNYVFLEANITLPVAIINDSGSRSIVQETLSSDFLECISGVVQERSAETFQHAMWNTSITVQHISSSLDFPISQTRRRPCTR